MNEEIPLYKPSITHLEREAVSRVLTKGKLSRGAEVALFEEELALFLNKKHVIAVSSGTAALDIAIKAVGFPKNGKVLATPYAYVATGNVLLENGSAPVFFDIHEETFNIDFSKVPKSDLDGISHALIVHNLGQINNYEEFQKLGIKRENTIEDCSQAFVKPGETDLGKFSDTLVFSLHESKVITTGGEGGVIATDNLEIAEKCRSLRDQGRIKDPNWLSKVQSGYSCRMTELGAAFGRAQLARMDDLRRKREDLHNLYQSRLRDLPVQLVSGNEGLFSFYFLVRDKDDKDALTREFAKENIALGNNYYPPLHLLPAFGNLEYTKGDFPISESIYDRLVALPFYYDLDEEKVDRVINVLTKTLEVPCGK